MRIRDPIREVPTAEERQARVAELLRDAAQRVASGRIEADAVLIVITQGDLHQPYHVGFDTQRQLWRASGAVREVGTPEEQSERRRTFEERARRERREYDRAHPWHCRCGGRYGTDRGLVQHIAIRTRRHRRLALLDPGVELSCEYIGWVDPEAKEEPGGLHVVS